MAPNKSEGIELDANDEYVFAINLQFSSGKELKEIFVYVTSRYLLSTLPVCLCLVRLARPPLFVKAPFYILIDIYAPLPSVTA